jgi:hypothetical protein
MSGEGEKPQSKLGIGPPASKKTGLTQRRIPMQILQ